MSLAREEQAAVGRELLIDSLDQEEIQVEEEERGEVQVEERKVAEEEQEEQEEQEGQQSPGSITRERRASKLQHFFGDAPPAPGEGISCIWDSEEQDIGSEGAFSYSTPGGDTQKYSSLSEVHTAHMRALESARHRKTPSMADLADFASNLQKSLTPSLPPHLAAGGRAEQRHEETREDALVQAKSARRINISGLDDGHSLFEYTGIYEVIDGKEVNGRGAWKKLGEEKFLFYAIDSRRWHICCTEDNLEHGRSQGWLRSAPNYVESDVGDFELFPSTEGPEGGSEGGSLQESHLTPDSTAQAWEGMVKEGKCLRWCELPQLVVMSKIGMNNTHSRRREGRLWGR
jgi:hypothetical protein